MEAIFQTQDKKKHNQESVERNTSHNYKKYMVPLRIQTTIKINTMTAINIYISIITLNVNGLNSPVKRRSLTEWNKKQNPSVIYKNLIFVSKIGINFE